MNVLALDTSTLACSVALDAAGNRYERHAVKPREHTRLLLPMIRELMDEAGLVPPDLDAVVLGNGPGSFIGMRIGASVAQGLCHGSGAQLVPVSSLAAIAAEAIDRHGAQNVLVAQDAHMGEVYLASFAAGADGLPVEARPVCLQPAGVIANLDSGFTAAGAGWDRYPALWEENRECLDGRLEIPYPHASWLVPLGRRALDEGGAVEPERLQPAYVREQVAVPPTGPRGN